MADIFDVVADATRREMLQILLENQLQGTGEFSVSEIVSRTGLTQPTVSKQLKVLREAGLVVVREDGQHRLYRLDATPLEELEDWAIPFLSVNFVGNADGAESERLLGDDVVAAAANVGSVAASTVFQVSQTWRELQTGSKDAVTKLSESIRKAARRS
ncbi:MAG: winged helix-turn-helix transcriptional regulator [Actinomycetales bacterium]|nr:winged helix-turn-helix transcriptional regulator [Actinomycetales bacterium]